MSRPADPVSPNPPRPPAVGVATPLPNERKAPRDAPGPFGGLSAVDAGRLAAEKTNRIRREKKEALEALAPEDRARARLAAEADSLMSDLLDAVNGRGRYKSLTASERFKALQLALAYGLGRPIAAKADKSETPSVPTAEDLF